MSLSTNYCKLFDSLPAEQKTEPMTVDLDNETDKQIKQSLNLLTDILGRDLLAVYLYGSAVVGGLKKYSDIDLFVVTNRAMTDDKKAKIIAHLLKISGIYMKSKKRSIEMTIVVKAEINPWRYPPKFDFQYGEWLRQQFEAGNVDPWPTKDMPDLALLVTQVLLANKILIGSPADQLLCSVPYNDILSADTEALPHLLSELKSDTRNVLLTLARIWTRIKTYNIRSKPAAADWVIGRLPEKLRSVMQRAKAIYQGETKEYWEDIEELVSPCANFIVDQINDEVTKIKQSPCANQSIKLADINFKKLTEADLKLLHQWFQLPHVLKWYANGKAYSYEEIQSKYLVRINDETIPNYIIYDQNKPIGYIQYYHVKKHFPEGIKDRNHPLFSDYQPNDLGGIDLFIADETYLHIGLSSEILMLFINMINKQFKAILVDPHKHNTTAIKFFEKNGFKKIFSQDDQHLLMIKELRCV